MGKFSRQTSNADFSFKLRNIFVSTCNKLAGIQHTCQCKSHVKTRIKDFL